MIEASSGLANVANNRALKGSAISAERRRDRGTVRPHPTTAAAMAYTPEELAFHSAIREYQAKSGRKFPTWAEVLGVVKEMGYERTA